MKKDVPVPFREEVRAFSWIFIIFVLGLALMAVFSAVYTREAIMLAFVAAIIAIVPLFFCRMITDIDNTFIIIRFGYLRWWEKKIPLSDVEHIEVVTYRPLRQFGGWGIRFGQFFGEKTVCYSMRGSVGVLVGLSAPLKVFLIKTKKLIIGSGMPEKLAEALTRARPGIHRDDEHKV